MLSFSDTRRPRSNRVSDRRGRVRCCADHAHRRVEAHRQSGELSADASRCGFAAVRADRTSAATSRLPKPRNNRSAISINSIRTRNSSSSCCALTRRDLQYSRETFAAARRLRYKDRKAPGEPGAFRFPAACSRAATSTPPPARLIAPAIVRTRAASFAPLASAVHLLRERVQRRATRRAGLASPPRRAPPRSPSCARPRARCCARAGRGTSARRRTPPATSIFGWLCGLYSSKLHQLRRGDLVRRQLRRSASARGCRSRGRAPTSRSGRSSSTRPTSRRCVAARRDRPRRTGGGRHVGAAAADRSEPRSKYAISIGLSASVKSMTFTPPWYQPCTYDVAPRHRDEAAVVRHAVLLRASAPTGS